MIGPRQPEPWRSGSNDAVYFVENTRPHGVSSSPIKAINPLETPQRHPGCNLINKDHWALSGHNYGRIAEDRLEHRGGLNFAGLSLLRSLRCCHTDQRARQEMAWRVQGRLVMSLSCFGSAINLGPHPDNPSVHRKPGLGASPSFGRWLLR